MTRPLRLLRIHECQHAPGERGGGAESGLRDEVQALKARGHTVGWLSSSQVEQAVEQFQPDVLHVGSIHERLGIEVGRRAIATGIPTIWHLHHYWPFCGPGMLLLDMHTTNVRPCAAVTGQCDLACGKPQRPEYLEAVNSAGLVVVGNDHAAAIMRRHGVRVDLAVESGIDTEQFCPLPEAEALPDTVCTGSAWGAMPTKGLHITRQALQGQDWNVSVITGLPRSQVPAALRKHGIFINTSVYEETFCLAIGEAMACGLAVVASDVAGARAQIEDGVTGLLYPNRDHVALREAVNMLRADAGLRNLLGRRAREHVLADHTLGAMAARWEVAYREVIRRQRARAETWFEGIEVAMATAPG